MQVFTVITGEYDASYTIGIFSSIDKATEYIKAHFITLHLIRWEFKADEYGGATIERVERLPNVPWEHEHHTSFWIEKYDLDQPKE